MADIKRVINNENKKCGKNPQFFEERWITLFVRLKSGAFFQVLAAEGETYQKQNGENDGTEDANT